MTGYCISTQAIGSDEIETRHFDTREEYEAFVARHNADLAAEKTRVFGEGGLPDMFMPTRVGGAADAPEEGEWPKRDAGPFVVGISVTDEMIKAGLDAWSSTAAPNVEGLAVDLYRAMAALAPVSLITDGEIEARRQRDILLPLLAEAQADRIRLRDQIADRDQAIVGLKSMLATRPEAVPETPEATPDPFRDFADDRRRMGNFW